VKLWAIYIGGEHPSAHIEIHDVRFVVAETVKATHDRLRAEWWGMPGTLHVDCYAEISHADGWTVDLRPEPSGAREQLWFVNLGGYEGKDFAEQHRNMFVVATSMKEERTARSRPFRTGRTRTATTSTRSRRRLRSMGSSVKTSYSSDAWRCFGSATLHLPLHAAEIGTSQTKRRPVEGEPAGGYSAPLPTGVVFGALPASTIGSF
jgi:hypothetical protein